MLPSLTLTRPTWSPATQGRLIRAAAVLVFVLIIVTSLLSMLKIQAMMHPPRVDRHHMFTPVHWGPFTLPSRSQQITWSLWLVNLFTPACYCLALWSSGRLFDHGGGRDAFPPVLARGLKRIGVWLIAGAIPALISLPFGMWLFFQANGKRLHLFGAFLAALSTHYPTYAVAIVLGLIGVVLLKAAGAGLRLRGTLDEFV